MTDQVRRPQANRYIWDGAARLDLTVDIRVISSFLALAQKVSGQEIPAPLSRADKDLAEELETRLGLALFDITSAGVALTDVGERFYQDNLSMRRRYDASVETARQIAAGLRGGFTLGVSEEITAPRFTALLNLIRTELPHIRLHLVEATSPEIAAGVRSTQIDLGLVVLPVLEAGLIVQPLLKDTWMIIFANDHPLASRVTVEPEELDGTDLILLDSEFLPGPHRAIRERLEASGVIPRVSAQVQRRTTMLSLVAAGVGATFVPSSFKATNAGRWINGPVLNGADLTFAAIYRANDAPGNAMQVLRLAMQIFDTTDGP